MTLVIAAIVGALAILAASVAGLLISAEAEARTRLKPGPREGTPV